MFCVILFNFNDTEQLGKETAYELTTGDFAQQYVSAHARLLPQHGGCYGDRCVLNICQLSSADILNKMERNTTKQSIFCQSNNAEKNNFFVQKKRQGH